MTESLGQPDAREAGVGSRCEAERGPGAKQQERAGETPASAPTSLLKAPEPLTASQTRGGDEGEGRSMLGARGGPGTEHRGAPGAGGWFIVSIRSDSSPAPRLPQLPAGAAQGGEGHPLSPRKGRSLRGTPRPCLPASLELCTSSKVFPVIPPERPLGNSWCNLSPPSLRPWCSLHRKALCPP